jgi:UDP-glucose 4-epimerase
VKLLVTGGAGYIGSIVARHLLEAGHEVVVLDNLERGHREAVPDGAELMVADLLDQDAVHNVLAHGANGTDTAHGFDAVLHFAALALVSESVSNPERYWRTNVGGTLNLLEAMTAVDVQRLVFSSTCAVYGQPDEAPIPETAPPRPINAYGATKLAVDEMIGHFCRANDLGAVSLRYFNVAGASGVGAARASEVAAESGAADASGVAGASGMLGEDHEPETHLIPNILRAALGKQPYVEIFGTDYPTPDGTAIRDYIHIDDLAEAHLLALDGTRAGEHRVFNLGNGNGFSVREVIAAAETVTGAEIPARESPRRPGDPPMLVAASERIREQLGWQARKPGLEEIVADAWAFAQAKPEGYSD